ncbi:MAG: hypothetical protein JW891_01115 [Candidatus Lokiarchaeota archaeon]|nr:hypothetical protein [Candidatus Lokiarchaeota archaeon]
MRRIGGNNFIKRDDRKIYLDNVPLETFLKNNEDPLMIFLENRIRYNLKTFQDIFSKIFENFRGFYSYKANFLSEICEIVNSEGIGAEVISFPELKLALSIGVLPENILVGGPYLPKKLIEYSVKNRVKQFIIYNIKDLREVNHIAKNHGIVQDICLRVNSQRYGAKLGFRLDADGLIALKDVLMECNNIEITTLLSHYGSQMNNPEQFLSNVEILVNNFKKLDNLGLKIKNINLGGGFPEASVMPKNQLEKIAISIKNRLKELSISYEQIYFEPGRYFIGDAGIFIARIINVIPDRWIFLNIGNHICPKFARSSLRFYNASQIENPHKFKTSIAGIIPSEQDVLVKYYFFTEKLIEGDIVLVLNVGAYNLTFSTRFPYTLPKIYLVKNNDVKIIFDSNIDGDFSLK